MTMEPKPASWGFLGLAGLIGGGASGFDIDEPVRLICDANRSSIDEQLDLLAVRGGDINRLLRIRRIIPMADDVNIRPLALHHARNVIDRFGDSHAVHFAADAQDVAPLLAAIGIGV